jgi:hypothetical protein
METAGAAKRVSNLVEMTPRMEEIIKRIMVRQGDREGWSAQANPTVNGVMLINSDGIPLKTTMDNTTTVQVRGRRGVINV